MSSPDQPSATQSIPDFAAVQGTFGRIYRENVWGGSGGGSKPAVTVGYRAFLQAEIARLGARSVVDLGCGDWQFSCLMDWSGVDYTGIDVDADLIARNAQTYGKPNIRFTVDDVFSKPPTADLLICKDVMQHWTNEMVSAFAAILPRFRFALITNCVNPPERRNGRNKLGGTRPLDLTAKPFSWPVEKVFSFVAGRDQKEVVSWDRERAVALGWPEAST